MSIKQNLRRIISTLLVISILPLSVFAIENPESELEIYNSSVTDSEQIAIAQMMQARNIYEDTFIVETLYNTQGEPQFLLGTSTSGYIIIDRQTYAFLEGGNGNPYQEAGAVTKYYGGLFGYYVKTGESYRNLITNVTFETIDANPAIELICQEAKSIQEAQSMMITPRAVVVGFPKYLRDYYDLISRRSFGNNTDGTCSAVACGIALYYLDKEYNNSFVPTDKEATELIGVNFLSSTYKQAEALHSFLRYDCVIGVSAVATAVQDGISNYSRKILGNANTLTMDFSVLNKTSKIKAQIDASKPALITTSASDVVAPGYEWHTMVVYGYRNMSDSSVELLVHTGWYGSPHIQKNNNDNKMIEGEIWIPASYATHAYWFNF